MADLVAAMSMRVIVDPAREHIIDYLLFLDREKRMLTSAVLKEVVAAAVEPTRPLRLKQILINRAGIDPERADAVTNYIISHRKGTEKRSRNRLRISKSGKAGRQAGMGIFDPLTQELAINMMVLDGAARKTACRNASIIVSGRTPDSAQRAKLESAPGRKDASTCEVEDAEIRSLAQRVERQMKSLGSDLEQMIDFYRSQVESDERMREGWEKGRKDILERLPNKRS